MTRWSLVSRYASALAVALVLLAPAGCGSGQSGGPLGNVTQGGQPNFAVSGGTTSPGQSNDATVYLVNSAQDPVTLVSASLIPIKGHPAGRLVLLKVSAKGQGVSARGWPIPSISARPFRRARLHHGESAIIFGFAGTRAGQDYMTAGLRVVYRYHGQLYTVLAWSASVACVSSNWRTGDVTACNREGDVVRRATEQLAGA
jgi:hypothetical protein